ncbi:MAG: SPOR domain-containing protein [Bacteroidia bacterium]
MKRLVLFVSILFLINSAVFGQGKIIYHEENSVKTALYNREKERTSDDFVMLGYRVFIGMKPNRNEANRFLREVNENLNPDLSAQLVFDEPNFKVYVGSFPTSAEAEATLAKVKKYYPYARKLKMPIKSHR